MTRPNFTIESTATIGQALKAIDSFHRGFVVLTDHKYSLVGTLTDGDIRRAILAGASMTDSAEPFAKKNCITVPENATREQILKYFDQRIRFLPVVNSEHIVQKVVSAEDLRYSEMAELVAKVKAPARISFGGGGTDLTPFFMEHGGAVLNATINMYSRATLRKSPSSLTVKLTSEDLNKNVEASCWEDLKLDGNLDLFKAAIKLLRPNFGFTLTVASDFPPSSGLGGSSVVLAAIIGAFNQFRDDKLSLYDIAELAFQAERLELNCSGGWQDQYAAVFGGINFMEFRKDRNEINSLKISPDTLNELEDRLIVCYSGKSHPVNSIHQSQTKKMMDDKQTNVLALKTRELAYAMKYSLQRGRIDDLGEMLHEGWTLKKSFANDISNPWLDEIYSYARANGAVGGKVLGAGGGGYFLFQSKPFEKRNLLNALYQKGLQAQPIMFEANGLQSWLVK